MYQIETAREHVEKMIECIDKNMYILIEQNRYKVFVDFNVCDMNTLDPVNSHVKM